MCVRAGFMAHEAVAEDHVSEAEIALCWIVVLAIA